MSRKRIISTKGVNQIASERSRNSKCVCVEARASSSLASFDVLGHHWRGLFRPMALLTETSYLDQSVNHLFTISLAQELLRLAIVKLPSETTLFRAHQTTRKYEKQAQADHKGIKLVYEHRDEAHIYSRHVCVSPIDKKTLPFSFTQDLNLREFSSDTKAKPSEVFSLHYPVKRGTYYEYLIRVQLKLFMVPPVPLRRITFSCDTV